MVNKNIRELCFRRIVHAVGWNIVAQGIFINLYLFLFNINIFHPLRWFGQWFSSLFSFYTWLYFLPLTLVIVSQGILCSRDYITLPSYYGTRFSFFVQMFSFHSQRVAFLHIFIGFLLPWIYLSLAPEPTYHRFIYSCSNGFVELECFAEDRLYLILSCVTVNIYYLLDNYFLGSRHLSFPIIQMPKLVQVKSGFLTMMKEVLPYTLIPNGLYMALYYFFGGNVRYFITSTFSLYYDNLTPVDSFQGLFSFQRLFYMFFLTGTTVASMRLMEMLFKVHLTERHKFPISQSLVLDTEEIILKDGLQCKDYPIMQHLAFLDLQMLAQYEEQRRAEIYKLSVPGGHPHVWNSLKNECLNIIDEFVEDLSALLTPETLKENPRMQLYQKSALPHDQPAHKLPALMRKNLCEQISESFFQWFSQKTLWFSNLPIIIYFFGELKEMRVRYALRRNLLVLWSAHTLSFLSCFSLTEDQYGIIQNDLSQIITSLLNLKRMLDLLDKYFLNVYKVPKGLASYQRCVALKKSVKRSIYRLSNSFKPYMADLQLAKDVESKMMLFVNYRE